MMVSLWFMLFTMDGYNSLRIFPLLILALTECETRGKKMSFYIYAWLRLFFIINYYWVQHVLIHIHICGMVVISGESNWREACTWRAIVGIGTILRSIHRTFSIRACSIFYTKKSFLHHNRKKVVCLRAFYHSIAGWITNSIVTHRWCNA